MTIFILPTSGATSYRGKYPFRARSISGSTGRDTGRHIELMNGTRLWSCDDKTPEFSCARLADDYESCFARAVPMTGEQYATLHGAAVLLRERAQIAGHGRRAELEGRVLALVRSIKADCRHYAKRNAENARTAAIADGQAGGRGGFNPLLPYRVRNRTPQFSGSFDFETLDKAREYLAAQLARRDSVVSGAAPVGPDSNSQCPMESFIFWAEGTETLGDMGWTPPATGARWTPPVPAAEVEPEAGDCPDCGEAADWADGRKVCPSCDWQAGPQLDSGLIDPMGAMRGTGELAPVPVRRDNVEYHAGRKAAEAGEPETACPYVLGLERATRWHCGWAEATIERETVRVNLAGQAGDMSAIANREAGELGGPGVRRVIDCTPTWSGILPALLAVLNSGTAEGRQLAKAELARMAGLADLYVESAK